MVTCAFVPHLKPFRALRYDPGTVGPLAAVVSPPHDVVTPDRREALVTSSPYNAVRLLSPESPEGAARLTRAGGEEGAFVRGGEPAVWLLEETFPGLDGGTRIRRGLVARVELLPYSAGQVLPHERTFQRQKEGRPELWASPRLARRGAPARAHLGGAEGSAPRASARRRHEALACLPRPRGL